MLAGIELTPRGIDGMAEYAATIREYVGYDIPLSADHFGHIGVNSLHPPRQGAGKSTTSRGSKT